MVAVDPLQVLAQVNPRFGRTPASRPCAWGTASELGRANSMTDQNECPVQRPRAGYQVLNGLSVATLTMGDPRAEVPL